MNYDDDKSKGKGKHGKGKVISDSNIRVATMTMTMMEMAMPRMALHERLHQKLRKLNLEVIIILFSDIICFCTEI
jgi:hypothetical protein